VRVRPSGWLGVLLLSAGCAASGRGDRPPAPGPAPSPAAISNVGYDRALRAGSDYVVASTGVDQPKLAKSQITPTGMLELTFDLGPSVPEPVKVLVDPNQGKVHSLEPVHEIPPGIISPAEPKPKPTPP